MYHANDRAHDLLATSAKQVATNSRPSTVTATQAAKDQQDTQKDAQHTAHYRNSAPSQG
jgi:biopolymer transport protein ExbB